MLETEITEIEITEEQKQELADTTMALLQERFTPDEFVFGPIVIVKRRDFYGDWLQIYIVYEGDMKNLDPKWTGGLKGRLRPKMRELFGIDDIPSCSFVPKRGWEEVHKGGAEYIESA